MQGLVAELRMKNQRLETDWEADRLAAEAALVQSRGELDNVRLPENAQPRPQLSFKPCTDLRVPLAGLRESGKAFRRWGPWQGDWKRRGARVHRDPARVIGSGRGLQGPAQKEAGRMRVAESRDTRPAAMCMRGW